MIFFSGCSDKLSRQKVCENLYSRYTARCDFIVSDGKSSTEGKADITKSDVTTVTFTEPEFFCGISITGDSLGNPDVFSLSLSGIPAEIPKSISSDLSLIFSLFSDSLPAKIERLGNDSFSISAETNELGNELVEVFFIENDMSFRISYDKYSGIPFRIDAGNDTLSVSVLLSDFETTE